MLIQITGETSKNTKGLGRIRLSSFCYQEGTAGISANPSDMWEGIARITVIPSDVQEGIVRITVIPSIIKKESQRLIIIGFFYKLV